MPMLICLGSSVVSLQRFSNKAKAGKLYAVLVRQVVAVLLRYVTLVRFLHVRLHLMLRN